MINLIIFRKHFQKESLLALIGLVIIIVFASSLNIFLLASDKRPPEYDYADYLSASIRIYNSVEAGSFSQLVSVISDPYRPPLVPMSALPFYLILGTSYQVAMLTNLLYLIILVSSIYKLTKAISHSTQAALIASGIVCFVPGVIAYNRVFGLDFPTMALVSAGLYFTVVNKTFSSLSRSIFLGVVTGLGMLTKWSYLFLYSR